jgi:hypothetical protein
MKAIVDAVGLTKRFGDLTAPDGLELVDPVGNVAVDNGRIYFRTWTTAGKARRIAHQPTAACAQRPALSRRVSLFARTMRAKRGLLEDGGAELGE